MRPFYAPHPPPATTYLTPIILLWEGCIFWTLRLSPEVFRRKLWGFLKYAQEADAELGWARIHVCNAISS